MKGKNKFSDSEKLNIIRLARSENIGPRTFHQMVKLFGGAGAALERAEEMSVSGGRGKPIKICETNNAVKEIEDSKKIGAEIICYGEAAYPKLLSSISDAPPILCMKGVIELLERDSVAIVGARNASANGCRLAHKIAGELGKAGYVLTSGLASGIDAAVHKGALETGTIAVVGGGVDVVYPKENSALYKSIAEAGLIISEHPVGTIPKAENFPRRNRIISGISLGVVVVEAAIRSGSLITARFASEQGREVMAVPGSPLDPRAEGPNKLIKQGAALVENANDIIEALNNIGSTRRAGLFSFMNDGEEILEEEQTKAPIKEDEIKSARSIIIEKIGASPVSIDELAEQTGVPAGAILAILIELELAGRLERYPGNKVALAA